MDNHEPAIPHKISPLPPGFLMHPVHFLALGFGSGYTPKLPGTAGTVVGVISFYFLQQMELWFYISTVFVLLLIGIFLCEKTARDLGVHDHSAIVWDEIVGYLVVMAGAPVGWGWMLAGFLLFRLFDIWKPWPIRWLDQKISGGLGIMIDDILAGIYGLIILQITAYLL